MAKKPSSPLRTSLPQAQHRGGLSFVPISTWDRDLVAAIPVCDFIFRLEAPGASRASSILRALRPIAAAEWMRRYNETVVHWETMVLPSAVCSPVAGACYRRAGYRTIGYTTGRSARRPPGSTHGPRVWGDAPPKLVLYFGPLARVSQA